MKLTIWVAGTGFLFPPLNKEWVRKLMWQENVTFAASFFVFLFFPVHWMWWLGRRTIGYVRVRKPCLYIVFLSTWILSLYIYNFRKVGNGALVQGHKHYLRRKHWVIKTVTTESLNRRSVVIMNDSGPLRYRPLTAYFTNLAVFKNGYKCFRCEAHLLFKPTGRFKERHSGRMKQSACTRFLLGQAEPVPRFRSEMQIHVFTPYRPAALLAGSFVPLHEERAPAVKG